MLNTHKVVLLLVIFPIIILFICFIWALAIISKSIVITFVLLVLLFSFCHRFSFHRIIFLLFIWVLIRFLLRWNSTSLFWMFSWMSGRIHQIFNIAHVCFWCYILIWIVYFQFHHLDWLCIWFCFKISCWLILITFLLLLAVRSF